MPQIKANGLDIEYETFGRPADPALVLIMGFASQMTKWQMALCEGLAARGLYVIRFDNRDVGKTTHLSQFGMPNISEAMAKAMSGQPVAAPYTLGDMAADVAGLLDALGIADAHIVGASMGGMIAQIMAANFPQKTRSLVSIMSTTARRDLPAAKPEAMSALMTPPASPAREDRIAASRRAMYALASPDFPASEEEMTAAIEHAVDRVPYDPAGIARHLMAVISATPRNEMLGRLRVPALVIHGADDPLIPVEAGKDTAASIPGAELVIVPGMAHDFTNAIAPVYLKHIADFVNAVDTKKKAA